MHPVAAERGRLQQVHVDELFEHPVGGEQVEVAERGRLVEVEVRADVQAEPPEQLLVRAAAAGRTTARTPRPARRSALRAAGSPGPRPSTVACCAAGPPPAVTASGSLPHSSTTSSAAGSAPRSSPTIDANNTSASATGRTSSVSVEVPSSSTSRDRDVTSTSDPGTPGSNGRTCSALAALSSTTSARLRDSSDRHNVARASSPSGSSSRPNARSSTPSASTGSIGAAARGVRVQVDEQLTVRIGETVRQVHGERGLADARHAVDRRDHDGRLAGDLTQEPLDLGGPAGEVGDVARERVQRRPRLLAAQQPFVQFPQLRAGIDAQFVGQQHTHVLERPQRLRRTARTVQRAHQLKPQLFAQRSQGGQFQQIADEPVAVTELDHRAGVPFRDGQSAVLEPASARPAGPARPRDLPAPSHATAPAPPRTRRPPPGGHRPVRPRRPGAQLVEDADVDLAGGTSSR